MKHMSYDIAEFKAVDGDGPKGLFAALVSVFNNVDRSGDRVIPGAFMKSLARWKSSGAPIPVIFSHEWKDPSSYIGEVHPDDVKETEEGLVVAGRLDIESNPNAKQVYELLRSNRLKEWSFGYEVKDERVAKDLARELVEVDLIEVGPTLKGANPAVRTLAMKEAPSEAASLLDPLIAQELAKFDGQIDEMLEAKIGRVISTKTEAKLRGVLAALQEVLSAVGTDSPDEQSSSSPEEAKAEEPEQPGEKELLRKGLDESATFLDDRPPTELELLRRGLNDVDAFLEERKTGVFLGERQT